MDEATVSQIVQLYTRERLSSRDIAKLVPYEKTRILQILRKQEVIRTRSESLSRDKSHWWKGGRCVTAEGYIRIKCPEHPYSNAKGYIYEHRLVIEQQLGRYLLPSEQVHHRGTKYPQGSKEDKGDNRKENLELISRANHSIRSQLCSHCELRTQIRLLRWQIKELTEQLQGRLV